MALTDLAIATPDLPVAAMLPARFLGPNAAAAIPASQGAGSESGASFGQVLQAASSRQPDPVVGKSRDNSASDGQNSDRTSGEVSVQPKRDSASNADASAPKVDHGAPKHSGDPVAHVSRDGHAHSGRTPGKTADAANGAKNAENKSNATTEKSGTQTAAQPASATAAGSPSHDAAASAGAVPSGADKAKGPKSDPQAPAQNPDVAALAGAAGQVGPATATNRTAAAAPTDPKVGAAKAALTTAGTLPVQLAAALVAQMGPKAAGTPVKAGPAPTAQAGAAQASPGAAAKEAVATASSTLLQLPANRQQGDEQPSQQFSSDPHDSQAGLFPAGSGPGPGGGKALPLLPGAEKGSITLVKATDATLESGSQTTPPGPNLQDLKLDDLVVTGVQGGSDQAQDAKPSPAAFALNGAPGTPAATADQPQSQPAPAAVPLRQTLLDQFQRAASAPVAGVKMILHPESLGTVHLHIQLVNGAVNAVIKVEHPEVREAISQQLDSLRQSFESQGIKIDKLEVNVSGDHHPQQDASAMMNFAGGQPQQSFQHGHRHPGARQYSNLSRDFAIAADLPEEAIPDQRAAVASVVSTLDLKA